MEIQTDLPKPPVHTAVQTCTKPKLPPPQNAAATFYLEALYNLIHISVLLHHHPSIHPSMSVLVSHGPLSTKSKHNNSAFLENFCTFWVSISHNSFFWSQTTVEPHFEVFCYVIFAVIVLKLLLSSLRPGGGGDDTTARSRGAQSSNTKPDRSGY
jgi:hypothetical protein